MCNRWRSENQDLIRVYFGICFISTWKALTGKTLLWKRWHCSCATLCRCQNVTHGPLFFLTAPFFPAQFLTPMLDESPFFCARWNARVLTSLHFIGFAELCLSVQLPLASRDRRCLSALVKDVICIWARLFYCLEAGTNHLARSPAGQFVSHGRTENYSFPENIHVFVSFLFLRLFCQFAVILETVATVNKNDV